jgi:hypothetical protein
LHLAITGEERRVIVSVEHPVSPNSQDVARLQKTLAWLATFARPEDAYRARLNQFAESPPELGISRLGLVRIAYEGNCSLLAELKGEVLRVSAEMAH